MAVTRRDFLRTSALGVAATSCLPLWTTRSAAASKNDPLLVVIFLRGGADGLSLVPPIGDPDYKRLRGSLAVDDALTFAPGFGLHPALAPLAPWVERKNLAVIHAAGSDHNSRSHFEAQDFVEMGTDGRARTRSGWLARGLRDEADADLFSLLALSLRPPLSMRGSGAFAMPRPRSFGIGGASEDAQRALRGIYAGAGSDPVAVAGRKSFEAIRQVQRAVGSKRLGRRGGHRGQPLVRLVDGLSTLERAGLGLRAAFLEVDGWDTHANQGVTRGALNRAAGSLGSGVGRLLELTAERREVITVVLTEFGRTARPNGSGGTDHGHGSAMLVAGPQVRGGVYGDWPGLSGKRLFEGRDLAVTTDYRNVLWEVLRAHLGRTPPTDSFPDFTAAPLGLFA